MLTLYVVNISWDDVFLCLNFYYEYLYLVPCKDFILQRRAAVNYHKHREDREEEEEEERRRGGRRWEETCGEYESILECLQVIISLCAGGGM